MGCTKADYKADVSNNLHRHDQATGCFAFSARQVHMQSRSWICGGQVELYDLLNSILLLPRGGHIMQSAC